MSTAAPASGSGPRSDIGGLGRAVVIPAIELGLVQSPAGNGRLSPVRSSEATIRLPKRLQRSQPHRVQTRIATLSGKLTTRACSVSSVILTRNYEVDAVEATGIHLRIPCSSRPLPDLGWFDLVTIASARGVGSRDDRWILLGLPGRVRCERLNRNSTADF